MHEMRNYNVNNLKKSEKWKFIDIFLKKIIIIFYKLYFPLTGVPQCSTLGPVLCDLFISIAFHKSFIAVFYIPTIIYMLIP